MLAGGLAGAFSKNPSVGLPFAMVRNIEIFWYLWKGTPVTGWWLRSPIARLIICHWASVTRRTSAKFRGIVTPSTTSGTLSPRVLKTGPQVVVAASGPVPKSPLANLETSKVLRQLVTRS